MDPSTKYHKFAGSQRDNENKPQKSKIKYKRLIIVLSLVTITCVAISTILIAVTVGITVSSSKESGQSVDKSNLTVIMITPEELQGNYYGSVGSIQFQSAVNSSYISLFIATTCGEPVVRILHPMNSSMTMMGVKSTNFFVIENQSDFQKYVDFVVPNNRMDFMQSMIMGQRNMSEEDLQQLDKETVSETRQSSLENLALSQEALLIIEAARAFDDRGMQGTEYPSIMSLYLLALTLAKAREMREGNFTLDSTEHIQKRQSQYSNASSMCQVDPFPYQGNNCFGLCGIRCWCWSSVCDDCCVHQFCLTHDECCLRNGYSNWRCWSVVWDWISRSIMCEQSYNC